MDSEFKPYNFSNIPTAEELKNFMAWCSFYNVSDIDIQGGSALSVSLHGRRCKASNFVLPNDTFARLIDEVFSSDIRPQVTGGKPVDRAFQLDGDVNRRYGLQRGERVRFRCHFIQGTAARQDTALSLTMRVIPSVIPAIESLSIEPELLAAMLPKSGLGLVCGETGSGKSTLMAALYRYCQDKYPDRKIVTYEDPVEYILGRPDDILPPHQAQIGRDVASFADGLKSAMRRNPELIGIGEIRDPETAGSAVAAGQSGHLCFGTVHTHSPGETIPRILGLFPPAIRDSTASALLGVLQFIVVQVLIRTVDGKRRALREYIVFDDALRTRLGAMAHEHWGEHLNNILINEHRRIRDQVAEMYIRQEIAEEEARMFIPAAELRRI